jgi:serine/threonine-protein kinase
MLRGELDTIILKSLHKAPERRYATVDAFGVDIRRYLAGRPVLAQPESRWYPTKKFIRRHRVPVVAACCVFLALAGGLSAALWEARVARDEARTSEALQKFTEEIFGFNSRDQPDPEKARQTTALRLLAIGAQKIDGQLNDAPAAKVRMYEILADLHHELDLDEQAVMLQKKRVALARKVFGPNSSEVAAGLVMLASDLHASRFVNEREKVLGEARDILDRRHDFNSKTRAFLQQQLAEHYQSIDLPKSRDYAAQAVKLYRQWPDSPNLLMLST